LGTGLFTNEQTDLALSDVVPIELTRSYREKDTGSNAFGVGMSDNYDIWISVDQGGQYTYADLILPDAGRIHYTRVSSGSSYIDAVFQANSSPTKYYGSKITWISGTGWTLAMKDGSQMAFGGGSLVTALTDRNGNTVQVQRGSGNRISQIVSPSGRWISFTYDGNGRVDRAQDNTGRTVWYAYDSGGHLSKVYDADGGATSYSYDSVGRMITFRTPNGNVHANNHYDSNNRVIQQTQPDGGHYNFTYLLNANGNVTETDMTDPRGSSGNLTFDSKGYSLSDTLAVGKPEQQTTTYIRGPNTELITSTTDTLGRTTAYTYDGLGNVTSVTLLSGTPQAATASFTYDPIFKQLTGIIDPLGHTWSFSLAGCGKNGGMGEIFL
jgi:YD repeat-containing protein